VTNETIQHHIRCCSDAKRSADEAAAELKKRLKAAATDGVNRKMVATVLRDRDKDPDKLRADLRDRIHYLALVNIPVFQADLFASADVAPEAATEHSTWEADNEGYTAGLAGAARAANSHPPGSELFAAWDSGYLRGQAKIAAGMKRAPKMASTRRKRAGNGEMGLPM
jgi:hypothetical protein